ncbi:M23 family peptidase [Fibrisoma montanum]|uniref:M23 family peptidase n=1 Tax=Fibrisoma montanum TaxID=2305895 RepID=A0A418M3T7_9BACT|nr:M23 family metallopeptidase [Fibrisoma montanum]RIV20475.1 M23 family peptidase [Fibrisoma montanum]
MTYRITVIICLLFAGLFLGCQDHQVNPDGTPKVSVALPSLPVKVTNTVGEWLVYDLHLHTPPGSTLQKIDVMRGNEVLSTFTDFSIRKDSFYLAHIWLPYPRSGWDVDVLTNRFQVSQSGRTSVSTFQVKIDRQYPDQRRVGFPVPSGTWFTEDAPDPSSLHTRALFLFPQPVFDPAQNGYVIGNNPQRYAIDFTKVVDGLPYKNKGDKNEDWYNYNLPVMAAEGGTVVFTADGFANNGTPGKIDYPIDFTNITGNVVYIEHSDGTLAMYAHMIPNSIRVKVGQKVTAGQELGRLGNSGNSIAPHLHFHVVANPDRKKLVNYSDGLFLEGLPYSFPAFRKLGTAPDNFLTKQPVSLFTPTTSELFTNVIPQKSAVIEF